MEHIEETILRMREENKRKKYSTLEEGIYLDGRIMTFCRRALLGEISVLLPYVMRQMPETYAKVKYPSEFRPKVILTTVDLSVNMGFTVFSQEISCEDIRGLAEHTMAVVHRANPDYRMYPIENLKKITGCFFSFRSHAMDGDFYNMILSAMVGGKLVQGSYNCPYKELEKWKVIVRMIWESILPLEEE